MTLDDLKRSLCSVLETGHIGTPVSMRLHCQMPVDSVDVYSALASVMKLCLSAISDAPESLIARQTSGGTQLNVLVKCVNGRTILATFGIGSVTHSVLEMLLIGNHGVVRLEGESRIAECLLTNDDDGQQWKTAVGRSLKERKQVVMQRKQMTSESIRETVEREIAGEWSLTNAHGCDLQRCLVSPEMRVYEDCGSGRPLVDPLPPIKLWLVLEENPDDCSGYKVVFGEDSGMFGLATPSITGDDVFLGFYGTFREAFDAM